MFSFLISIDSILIPRLIFLLRFLLIFSLLDSERSKKLGFDEYIQSDPCKFDHHDLFKTLQTATLDYRLNDPYCSLVNIDYICLIIFFNM